MIRSASSQMQRRKVIPVSDEADPFLERCFGNICELSGIAAKRWLSLKSFLQQSLLTFYFLKMSDRGRARSGSRDRSDRGRGDSRADSRGDDKGSRNGGGKDETDGTTSLLVRNLSYRVRADEIRRIFVRYGDIRDVYIPQVNIKLDCFPS